jgi:hypothetical protein
VNFAAGDELSPRAAVKPFKQHVRGTIVMNEQQSLWLLGWTVGSILVGAFVLNAIALATI